MKFKNILAVFFVIVIILSLVSMLPGADTGGLIEAQNNDLAWGIIVFSLFMVLILKVKKKHYIPTPSHRYG